MKNPSLYEEQMVRKALMDMKGFVWCPKCSYGGLASCDEVICSQCNFRFCAQCLLEFHSGISYLLFAYFSYLPAVNSTTLVCWKKKSTSAGELGT